MSTVKANTLEPASGGTVTITGAALTTPALGTPASGTLTNCTGLPASGVVNTPAGGISATNVQAALNELDTEKLDKGEEGTWTPGQGSAVTVVGTYSSSGRYTKIGRLVTIQFMVAGSTSIEVPSGSNFITGLPFAGSSGVYFVGSALNGSATFSSNPMVLNSIVYSAEAIAATNAIYGTCTYMV